MRFTRIGTGLFDWEPFNTLGARERNIWLALYISREAKRIVPGLFHGGVTTIAEAARVGFLEAQEALRLLEDRNLIERDDQARLTRLTSLPDKGERPANGRCLRGFWNRWSDLPESLVKLRHVTLLRWLTEPLTADHQRVWDVTFGTIDDLETVCETVSEDNLWISPQKSMFPEGKETVVETVSHTVGLRVKGSGEGSSCLNSRPRARGRMAPFPPSKAPFTVEQLLDAVAEQADGRIETRVWDHRKGDELWALAEQCGEQGVTLDDVRLVGEWIGRGGGLSYRSDLDVVWLAKPGNLISSVAHARKWRENGYQTVKERNPRAKSGLSAEDLLARSARLQTEET